MGYGPQDHKRIRQDLASKEQKHLLLSWFSVLAALKKKNEHLDPTLGQLHPNL